MKFTDEQQRAIDYRVRHLQLIACAGSGKTEVVARRVANLLEPGREGVDVYKIKKGISIWPKDT